MFIIKKLIGLRRQHLLFIGLSVFLSIPASRAEPMPSRVPSFGPNGTHWPGQVSGLATPYMYDENVPNKIDVDPTFSAISAAINGLTSAQVDAGVLIRVRPGTLAGLGGSSASQSVMVSVGNKAWSKRVTVCPRDGWGTVTISNGMRWDRVRNVCFAGFIIDGKIRIQHSTRFAFARCLLNGNLNCYGEVAFEPDPRQWEFVEFVKREVFQLDDTDPLQLQVFPNMTKDLSGVVFDGSYFAPNYMWIGSKAHQDTIQHLSSGSWYFGEETIQDTVVFASNRCAVAGGMRNTVWRNCWMNSRKNNQTPRYPIASGAEMLDTAGIQQGSSGNITIDGGVYMGKFQSNQFIDDRPYRTVINGAKIDKMPSGHILPVNGAWIEDTTLNGHTKPGYPPLPTDQFLQSIWSKGAQLPSGSMVIQPIFIPPGDVYDSQQSVTISSPTPGASIHYTTDGSDPTSASKVYTSPITVDSTTTIKAFAAKDGLDRSQQNAARYEIKTVTPVFLPGGGEFILPQSISISSSTAGVDIYYTLDGTAPSISSSRYTGPFEIASNRTLKAIAVKPGLPPSEIRTANYVIGEPTRIVSEDWTNLELLSQPGNFEMSWSFMPTASGIDVVMGVGAELAESYSDLACIVRFMTTGMVDARDGSSYKSVTPLTYELNKTYQIRINVDFTAKRYSATVTPVGGNPIVVAQDYAFRTEQGNISSLGTFAFVRHGSGGGTLSNIAVGSAGTGPSRPRGLRVVTKKP